MKRFSVTFDTLQRFLTDLGFVMHVGKAAVLFDHPASGCRLFYPLYREREEVSLVDLTSTRHFLDQFGLVERSEFEDLLRQHALAS